MPGHLEAWKDLLQLYGVSLPETTLASATDRRLSEIVQLPFPYDARIASTDEINSGLRVRLNVGHQLMNTRSGRIWPDQE